MLEKIHGLVKIVQWVSIANSLVLPFLPLLVLLSFSFRIFCPKSLNGLAGLLIITFVVLFFVLSHFDKHNGLFK